MIVYELRQHPERFCSFAVQNEADRGIYSRFDGAPLKGEWKEYVITAADEPDESADLPDFALLGIIPIFSEQAVTSLRDILEANGELLRLRYARREYWAYNVTTLIDALDERQAVVQRFSTGRVMVIDEYAFRREALSSATIFKIPQLLRGHVYVTDVFASRVRQAELVGFAFHRIWSDTAEL